MVSPKFKNKILWVKAVPEASVREIDEQGRPLSEHRIVGKDFSDGLSILKDGQKLPYHSHYIARLKEKALLPMDLETAVLSGVSFETVVNKRK